MSLSINENLAANYADYYERGDGLSEWRRLGALDKCSNIVRLCSALAHDKVLEIGCGEGAILERLVSLRFGSSWAGLEISSSAIRRVEQKRMANVEVRLFDGDQVPYEDQSVDLAILSHVLEHVEYPRRLIYEAARVAKYVFVEVPLEDNTRLPADFTFDRVGHINFYNPKTIRQLVQSCGMHIRDAHLSHNSLSCYVYRKGKTRGCLSYLVKQIGLKFFSQSVIHFATYNYALTYAKP